MMTSNQISAKLVMIGPSGVGKTSLLTWFRERKFTLPSCAEIDVSVRRLHMAVDGVNIALQVWDTVGQERFFPLTASYLHRNTDAVMVVYDVTNETTFQTSKELIINLHNSAPDMSAIICIVANCVDNANNRMVSAAEGRTLAHNVGGTYFETSAFKGFGVDEVFTFVGKELVKKMQDGSYTFTVTQAKESSTFYPTTETSTIAAHKAKT